MDLSDAPAERWLFAEEHVAAARGLVAMYNDDLGVSGETVKYVATLAPGIVPADLLAEMEGLSAALGMDLSQTLLANLHYDMFKVVLGCTAFAVPTPAGPFHARNLDWWTSGRALNDGTVITQFINGPAGEFLTVGWPGFVGAFSGVAHGRFCVTLNAVLSDEPAQIAMPVVLLIRQVLEKARDFDEAVDRLSTTPIAMDCLLLVTGIENEQRVVIERTPTRHAQRRAVDGDVLRVANDFVAMDASTGEPSGELQESSCGRYERIGRLVEESPPQSLDGCLEHLRDEGVMMGITVQQMAFHAASGEFALRVP